MKNSDLVRERKNPKTIMRVEGTIFSGVGCTWYDENNQYYRQFFEKSELILDTDYKKQQKKKTNYKEMFEEIEKQLRILHTMKKF